MKRDDIPPPPCLMVIFGGAGDLTHRLLAPALYNLCEAGRLPERFGVVGIARHAFTTEEYRKQILQAIGPQVRAESANELVSRFHYWQADSTHPDTYSALEKHLNQLSDSLGTGGSMIFYLATPPSLFSKIPEGLAGCGLLKEKPPHVFRRVIFEKPFGRDFASAHALNQTLSRLMNEQQIYRIDHYLGKETVQNIMVMRFANGIFEPIWNRRFIDSVQITVAERLGVESRGAYYDASGALRDMVPNHLFQLISLMAMEPPNTFAADDVRDEKVKLLRAITSFTPDRISRDVVRGQYAAGDLPPGRSHVPGYRQEPNVSRGSNTETFVALKLGIENWRWAGVPFYVRTGKRLPVRSTEIDVRFRCAPYHLFRGANGTDEDPSQSASPGCPKPNQLILGIQPDEMISLRFSAKLPGPLMRMQDVAMEFNYARAFNAPPQTGYETLLFDAMHGDATLYQRSDQAEAAWEVVDPILKQWERQSTDLRQYPAGSWGPAEADELVARDGRQWRNPVVEPAPETKKREEAA